MNKTDQQVLVDTLLAGLLILVRDGLIDEGRAIERARNQAMALLGEFELTRLADAGDTGLVDYPGGYPPGV